MTRDFGHRMTARLVSLAAVPIALALAAAPASAQFHAQQQPQQYPQRYPVQQQYPQRTVQQYGYGQQEILNWQGPVDKEIRIAIQGGRASLIRVGNNERASGRVRAMAAVPAQPGYVTVQGLEGRGRVDVIQQPSAQNNYTTIIRLRDPDSGSMMYHIAAYWQPTGNMGNSSGRGRWNRDRGNSGNGVGVGAGSHGNNGHGYPW